MVPLPSFDLSNRVVLLTGASSGFGARWARLLAGSGARVVLCARRLGHMELIVADIEAAGGTAIAVATDVADEASVINAFDAAERAFGTVDTIIANAGVSNEGRADRQPIEAFDQTVAINLRGAFLTAREGARRLIENGSKQHQRGRIVITASITAFDVSGGISAYSATKAGVLQMGKVMARDWANYGINVNMICPGYIKTDLNADWFATEGGAKQIAGFPRRRLGDESDLDVPLLWLASDLSHKVTGSAITVDDGQSL